MMPEKHDNKYIQNMHEDGILRNFTRFARLYRLISKVGKRPEAEKHVCKTTSFCQAKSLVY